MTDPTRSLTDDIAAALEEHFIEADAFNYPCSCGDVLASLRSARVHVAYFVARAVSARAEALAAQWDERSKRLEAEAQITDNYRGHQLYGRLWQASDCADELRSAFTDPKEDNGD